MNPNIVTEINFGGIGPVRRKNGLDLTDKILFPNSFFKETNIEAS